MFKPLCLLSLTLLFGTATYAQEKNRLEPIAPLLDAQTFAVVRADLARIDAGAAVEFAAKLSPSPPEDLKAISAKVRGFLATLREYGAQDLYVIASLADIPESPPPVLLTLKPGGNEALLIKHVQQIPNLRFEAAERINNVLVFGSKATLARLKANQPVPRPDLSAALAAVGDAPVQVAAAIPADVQRVVKELVGKLPPDIGGGQGQNLLDALQWSSLAIETPPKVSLKWTIQSKDDASAADLRPRILAGLNLLGKQTKLDEAQPDFAELAIRLTPAVKGSRLELTLAGDEAEKLFTRFMAAPLANARGSALKLQSINNLKQIALAMHNYHDTFNKFPGPASLTKEGKPLLSWRVHILPYIEQAPLYNQFKLDEPWDSEHNRKLIPLMPKLYLDPANPQLAKEGKSIYALPVGEKSAFSTKEGTQITKIVDGTSNTLMVVDLPAADAVVWTKPEDWNFVAKDPALGLLDGKRESFLAAYCDGSVHSVPADIDRTDLRRLVQMNDGEPLSKPY